MRRILRRKPDSEGSVPKGGAGIMSVTEWRKQVAAKVFVSSGGSSSDGGSLQPLSASSEPADSFLGVPPVPWAPRPRRRSFGSAASAPSARPRAHSSPGLTGQSIPRDPSLFRGQTEAGALKAPPASPVSPPAQDHSASRPPIPGSTGK